jgi:hypothetical protein
MVRAAGGRLRREGNNTEELLGCIGSARQQCSCNGCGRGHAPGTYAPSGQVTGSIETKQVVRCARPGKFHRIAGRKCDGHLRSR